jgi:hypothetical protein
MACEIDSDDYYAPLQGLGRARAAGGAVFATAVAKEMQAAGGVVPTVPGVPSVGGFVPNTLAQVAPGFSIQLPKIPGVSSAQIFKVASRTIPGSDDLLRIINRDLPPVAKNLLNKGVGVAGQMAWKVAGPPLKDFAEKALGGGVTAGVTATLGAAGSMIPGIGNLVGLAIAGLTAAFKALFKFLDDPDECEFDPKCPDLAKQIENLTPIEALPLIARLYVETSKRLAEKAYSDKCYLTPKKGKGGKTYKCLLYIEKAFAGLAEIAKDTPDVLGLDQLTHLIPLYTRVLETTTTQGWTNNENFSGQPKILRFKDIGEREGKVRDYTTRESVAAWAAYYARRGPPPANVDAFSFKTITARMIARQQALTTLANTIASYNTTPATARDQIPFGVGEELTLAAEQYVLNPNKQAENWLRQVGTWQGIVEARTREIAYARQEENRRSGRAAIVAKTPAQIQLLQMQCDEAQGRGPACDELRRLRPGGVPTQPAPAPAPPRLQAPGPTQRPDLAALSAARNKYVFEYLQKLSREGNPAAKLLFADAQRQPGAYPFAKTYAYLERRSKEGVKPAQIILYAAVQEFQTKLRAA